MCSQTFVLRLRLPQDMTQEEAVEHLGVADCSDVLVGVGEPKGLALAFNGPVVLAEIEQVGRAMPAAVLLSFSPDVELSS